MELKLRKSTFGFGQNCTLEVNNRSDGVHVEILSAEHPSLIDGVEVVCWLVNAHAGEYDNGCYSMKQCKESANKGFLAKEIKYLEDRLSKAKFAQELAKRNNIKVFDRTEVASSR